MAVDSDGKGWRWGLGRKTQTGALEGDGGELEAGDVAEAKWDASGAHVRKRARLKKKGSMKREAHECMSTRTGLLVPSSTYPISPSDSQSQWSLWR